MTRELETQALILDTTPYRDRDLVVKLFLPGWGAVSGIAYSARKSCSRFPSGLDRLTLMDVELAGKRNRLPTIRSAVAREVYWGLRSCLERGAAASLLAELLMRSHAEPEESHRLFRSACAILAGLEQLPPEASRAAALLAVARVLVTLRLIHPPFRCHACGQEDPRGYRFNTGTGELVCLRHDRPSAGTIAVNGAEATAVRLAIEAGDAVAAFASQCPGDEAGRVLDRLAPFLSHVFGAPLRSLEFLQKIVV
jgi:DNA repair protein RecO